MTTHAPARPIAPRRALVDRCFARETPLPPLTPPAPDEPVFIPGKDLYTLYPDGGVHVATKNRTEYTLRVTESPDGLLVTHDTACPSWEIRQSCRHCRDLALFLSCPYWLAYRRDHQGARLRTVYAQDDPCADCGGTVAHLRLESDIFSLTVDGCTKCAWAKVVG